MAARRSAQSLSEALHGLTLSSAQTGRMALVSRSATSSSSRTAAAAVSTSQRPARSFSTSPSPSSASPSATRRSSSSSFFSPSSLSSSTPPPASAASSVVSIADRTVPVTVFAFPSLEPRALEMWSAQHLQLPLRRDLLHLAVVYEGDNTRQGTASSKTRYDVHGSHRKMRQQKGSGMARVGSRQSPMLRGGGKTFGPHPRDFGTDLNRKVYDRAWRTALSYRYRRGELFVCEDGMELPLPEAFLRLAQAGTLDRTLEDGFVKRYVRALLNGDAEDSAATSAAAAAAAASAASAAAAAAALLQNGQGLVSGISTAGGSGIGSIGQAWGRASGRTTFITTDRRPNLFTSLETAGEDGRALEVADVDVKDLLETGRIVVEREALREMLERHQSDLVSRVYIHGARPKGPETGRVIVG